MIPSRPPKKLPILRIRLVLGRWGDQKFVIRRKLRNGVRLIRFSNPGFVQKERTVQRVVHSAGPSGDFVYLAEFCR